jgi:hypothetical protein
MNIQIHSVRFDADKKLIDFVHQKLDKLTQFDEDIVNAEVYLRLDKDQEGEMGRYQSGQLGQTVNLLAYAFVGSNPALPTTRIATVNLKLTANL